MSADLTGSRALALRMRSLLLAPAPGGSGPAGGSGPTGTVDHSVADVVGWFGAMQSQDLASGLWSLGVRLPGRTRADIEAALERREALRTWPMRGTVHLIPSRDAHWMLEVLGERPLAAAASRRAYLGLDATVADRAVDVLGSALAGGGRMTRAECVATLEAAGISGAGQRAYHLLWFASQRGVTCIAPNVAGEQTFVLLDEWVPDPVRLERDEALATIALRYFRSHGPTSRQDFAGWTGLTAADAKRGILLAGDGLARVSVEGREAYVDPAILDGVAEDPSGPPGAQAPRGADGGGRFLVLPGFDEYLLGYKDRSLMLHDDHKQAIIPGGNGVFQATVVRDGHVVGTWRRTVGAAKVTVTVAPLVRLSARERGRVEAAVEAYGAFLQLPADVRWPEPLESRPA